jgi:hypothetical protein
LSSNQLDTTICDKVCQWLSTGRWFSPGTPVYFYFFTPITQILFNIYLVTFLPQGPSSSEVSLWNSVTIYKSCFYPNKRQRKLMFIGYLKTNSKEKWYIWVTWRVIYKKQELLTLREHLRSPSVFLSTNITDYIQYISCYISTSGSKRK